ncbi:MAG: efflux transporter outer membrane subunit [Nevskia sp.]|nr:efflux transporter outer membrane subunit [Nevskia sp.]
MTSRVDGWRGGLAACVGAALVAACAVGPDFQRPAPPQPERYTAEPLPATTASTAVAGGEAQTFSAGGQIPAQWWTLFHSEPLNALVEEALRASPTVEAAQAALRQANENLRAQRGSLLPTVDGSATGNREKIAGAQFGQPGLNSLYSLFNASVNVSYGIDLWGGERREIEALAAQADYQRFQLEASDLTLSSNVVTTAIQVASLRGQIAATQDIVADDRRQLEVVQHQLALGGTSRLDVLTQQTELASALASLPPLQKQLEQNLDLLAVLLGRLPSQGAAPQLGLDELRLPQELPLSLPSQLVEQRPDVRAQEALLHQASAEVGVATANLLPQVTLNASFGGTNTKLYDLLNPSSNIWSIGAGVTQPLFHGGTLIHKKRAAVAAYEQAVAQYRGTVLNAFQNVADALHALQLDADALQAQNQAEQAAAAALDVARKRYQAGAVSHLELLATERSYQQSRIALLQAQAARFADTAALLQALGGGWWNRDGAGQQAAADR